VRFLTGAVACVGETCVLIVEDDLALPTDPNVVEPFGSIGDFVIHWHDLDRDIDGAVQLLRQGASGYPLNAFLCAGSHDALDLSDAVRLSPRQIEAISASVRAIVVSCFDAETFLVYAPVCT
jgi:hypothetical protein